MVHHRPETQKGRLDFGTLGVGERRSMTFTLRNDNPVDVSDILISVKFDCCKIFSYNIHKIVLEV